MRIRSAAILLVLALSAPSFAAKKTTLAVMDFVARDVPKEDAVKISHIVRNEMSNLRGFRILDREQVAKALGGDAACDEVSCAIEAGKKLGARKVLAGSIMKFGENMTITGRIIDIESGTIEMSEKERALFQADEYYMVERFCDRLARRMTGQALYGKEQKEVTGTDMSTITYRAPRYHPAADPTAWLALGGGIASGMGFLAAASSYETKRHVFYGSNMLYMSMWQFGADPMFPDPDMQMAGLLGLINTRSARAHAERVRNTEYYVAAGIGGFAVLMLTTFIGRNIADAVHDRAATKKIDISLVMPSPSVDAVPATGRMNIGFGLGLAMHF